MLFRSFCLLIVLAILHETEIIIQTGSLIVSEISLNSALVKLSKLSPWLFLGFILAKDDSATRLGRPLLFLVLSYAAFIIAELYAGMDYPINIRELISGKSYATIVTATFTQLGMRLAVIWAYAIALLRLAGKLTASAKQDATLGLTRLFLILAGLSLLTIVGSPLFYIFEALAYGSLGIYLFTSGNKQKKDTQIHIVNDLPR